MKKANNFFRKYNKILSNINISKYTINLNTVKNNFIPISLLIASVTINFNLSFSSYFFSFLLLLPSDSIFIVKKILLFIYFLGFPSFYFLRSFLFDRLSENLFFCLEIFAELFDRNLIVAFMKLVFEKKKYFVDSLHIILKIELLDSSKWIFRIDLTFSK